MSGYNSRIVREGGLTASVLGVASGGSVRMDLGGDLGLKSGATTKGTPYDIFSMGGHQFWFAPGSPGSPIFSASPGDICWIAGSAGGLWINSSDGTTGSSWSNIGDPSASTTPAGP